MSALLLLQVPLFDQDVLPFWVLVGLSLALPIVTALPWKRHETRAANAVLGIATAFTIVAVLAMRPEAQWLGVVALVPALLVVHQMFFLWLNRPERHDSTGFRGSLPIAETDSPAVQEFQRFAEEAELVLERTLNRYYSPRTLFVRYGVPAILLAIVGFTLLNAVTRQSHLFHGVAVTLLGSKDASAQIDLMLRGARYGLAGAYLFVLLTLGRRAFRQDITSGSATWALVGLVTGPALGAIVALVWRIQPAADSPWQAGVVLFFAGFAPQRVIGALEQAAIHLLQAAPAQAVQTRIVPLTQVRGIDGAIAQRLDEEGIHDADMLAFADPIRLVRNTSYDLRQILSWMDEALLMVYLPTRWNVLEENGVTGAIDLAWYVLLAPNDLAALATLTNIPESVLRDTSNRLFNDQQVRRVWVLYNAFTEDQGESPEPDRAR